MQSLPIIPFLFMLTYGRFVSALNVYSMMDTPFFKQSKSKESTAEGLYTMIVVIVLVVALVLIALIAWCVMYGAARWGRQDDGGRRAGPVGNEDLDKMESGAPILIPD